MEAVKDALLVLARLGWLFWAWVAMAAGWDLLVVRSMPDTRHWSVWVSLGLLLVLSIVSLRAARKLARFLVLRSGCCVCGYNLTGNVSGVCPECGTPVPSGTAPPARQADVREEGNAR